MWFNKSSRRRVNNTQSGKKISFRKILIPILLAAVIFLLSKLDVFLVKNVAYELDKINCTNSGDISSKIKLTGQNLWLINNDQIIQKIESNYLCVKSVTIEKRIPSSLKIKLVGRSPFAVVKSISGDEVDNFISGFAVIATDSAAISSASAKPTNTDKTGLLIDQDGVLYDKETNQNGLPTIFYQGKLSLGDQDLVMIFKQAAEIFSKLKTFNLNSDKATVTQEKYAYFYTTPKTVFNLNPSLDNQLASLQLILETAKIKNENIEVTDLRFDKPIIRFAPKK